MQFHLSSNAQEGFINHYYAGVFEENFIERKAIFLPGSDSLYQFFLNAFKGFDTILANCIEQGDTNRFIRIYFSYIIDENGFVYQPIFERIAATPSASTQKAKTLGYFNYYKQYLQKMVKQMMYKMPRWKPGLQHGRPVKCRFATYLQIWVGKGLPLQ
jgi:hypothetical protein